LFAIFLYIIWKSNDFGLTPDLVVYCNFASILHHYGDIKPQSCV